MTSTVSIVTLLASTLSVSLVSAASEFLPYAEVLADNDVIGAQTTEAGYRLGATITRAELAKVTANLGGYVPTDCAGDVYGDVDADLGDLCGYIEALAEAGVVSTANANYRPAANVTRAEAVKLILGSLGESTSEESAGYMDVTSVLGDLAGYINRANELGVVGDADYFRPSASITRGEAFKIAAAAAGLEMDTTDTTTDTTTTTGTTTTTTGTTSTVGGALTAALEGTAVAQYVPKNASSVKVGTVKLSAATNDVTVQSLTVSRSGLGNAADIASTNGVRAAQNGVVISSSADYYNSTSQKATVYFSPALVVKAGSSAVVDVLVNLSGSENSQHQFTLDSVNTNGTVTGAPITLGLLNTTSYVTTTTTASLTSVGGNVTPGKMAQLFAKVDVTSGGRDTKVLGFTLTRSGSTDFTKRLQNVMVYRNGVAVGSVAVTGEKLAVYGLTDVLSAGNTQTYELKADILVDSNSSTLGYKFDSTTDVSATEVSTGYSTQVSYGTASQTINFNQVEVTFEKTSTGTLNIAPGTNNVRLFSAKLSSTVPLSVRGITIGTGRLAGTGITGFVNDQLSVKINGAEVATLTDISTSWVKTVSFVVDSANPAVVTIEGSVKNNASVTGSYQFNVALTDVRDSSNNAASIGAGSSLTGDKTTVATSTVNVKPATVAAATTKRIFGNATQEIGRFALEARNEPARVQTIAMTATIGTGTAPALTATLGAISNSTSSVKLYNADTNAQVSTTASISGNVLTFSSMNDVIGTDITRNYKVMLDVSSLDSYYGQTVQLGTPTVTVVRDANSTSISPTVTATSMKEYSLGIVPPTVTVTATPSLLQDKYLAKITVKNTDSNTGLTLTGITVQFSYRYQGAGSAPTFTGSLCLRDEGSSNACSSSGTTVAVTATQAGVTSFISRTQLMNLTTAPSLIDKNGQTATFEVYLDGAPLWTTGDNVSVSVRSLDYTVGSSDSNESYVGVTGASASSTK
jgi:hypothetical protein